MSSTSSLGLSSLQNDPKKLVEYLLSDLRNLSTEAKKKHNHVKEAAESGIVKVRNISTNSQPENLLQNIRAACAEVLHPLILGCSSKNPKLVQISLQAVQRMLQFRVVDPTSAPVIVNELWHLTEAECEELRVLQTITPFVSTELLVTDWALAKCIVLAIKLNFSKDPSVINAASAAVRQLFSCVFERVIQEDGLKSGELQIVQNTGKKHQLNQQQHNMAPPTLRPAAADGYLLLKDLTLLIRKENPVWLAGCKRITMTLALELLESVLKNYPSMFFKHAEYADLLKNHICPQLVRMFIGEKEIRLSTIAPSNQTKSPEDSAFRLSVTDAIYNFQQQQQQSAPTSCSKPGFPIMMRSLRIALVLVTHYHSILALQNEVLITFLLQLIPPTSGSVDNALQQWQAAMALEVLHKMFVQPTLLRWLCENYDSQPNATPLVRMMLQKLVAFTKWVLEETANSEAVQAHELGNGTTTSSMFGQSGFLFKGVFIPLHENLSVKRWILLDWLEKHEAGPVPEGYCLSIAYACLVDSTHSIFAAIDQKSPVEGSGMETNLSRQLFYSTYSHLLDGLAILLDCSIDDTISDAILNCLSTIVILACRFGATPHTTNSPTTNHPENPKEQALKTICQAALPQNYFHKFIETLSPTTLNQHHASKQINGSISKSASQTNGGQNAGQEEESKVSTAGGLPGVPSQVVAMGTICPIPCLPPSMFNFTVMLTAKNMQVSRVLIGCAQSNGQKLTDCWDMVLAVLQHLVWILGMKPTSAGSFRTGGDTTGTSLVALDNSNSTTSGTSSAASSTVLTTAVSSELPDLNLALNRLFESTSTFDDVSLHHVIAALCKLSSEAMMVVSQSISKEPSFFSVAKLLQTAVANLPRLEVFWKPVTAHLLEVCAHTNTCLREWGAVALTVLVKNAMKQLSGTTSAKTVDLTKKESLILTPLAAMSEVEFVDVRTKQLDCLMHVLLESDSQQLMPQIWPLIVGIVTSIVDTCSNAQLIEQGYAAVSLMVKEFLGVLPFDCVQMLVETDAKYGQQQLDLNVSLAAVGQLWDISDYVRRESVNQPKESQVEHVWLVIYKCLSELCVDQRPPVRKSACDTLLQTVAAHGHALKPSTWSEMLWKTLFPMLDKVRVMTTGAKTERTNTTALGATNIMIHHSRDTESKQWAETTVKTLSGVVKIFNSQRSILLSLDTFSELWPRLLEYIEMTASMDNSEMSLAALKNLQELLFGRQQGDNKDKQSSIIEDTSLAQLPEKLWLVSWATWIRIAWLIVQPTVKGEDSKQKSYIPGPFHLTTLLHIFIPLFNKVRKHVQVDEIRTPTVPTIFKEVASIPISSDQQPFVMNAENSELSLTQECILECIRVVVQEQLDTQSRLRAAIPDMLRLLLEFVQYAIRPPAAKFASNASGQPSENQIQYAQQKNLIAFAELSLRTVVDYYSKVANYSEVLNETILVDIVQCLAEPLALKYHCPNQSTWKIAATSLIKAGQVGLPIAREQVELFSSLWPQLAETIEGFLFSTSKSVHPLNADERKRHEFVDCLVIELIRNEILPYAGRLPRDFMRRIIDILNRGSINTMDANDLMASDSFQQRADLSRVCFDALLSMSRTDSPDISVKGASSTLDKRKGSKSSDTAHSLGATAIASLLSRCKQVLNKYAKDEQGSGHFRLPQERIFETISVLRAVSTLIDGLAKHGSDIVNSSHSTLYAHLVGLHPSLVQLIPSCRGDQQVELALMTALNSYQTLLLINIHQPQHPPS